MKEFKVDQEFILEAYNAACDNWKKKLKSKFPEAWPKNITDKVKTFEDVESILGKVVLPYTNPSTKQQVSTNASVKIQHISKALNEGWTPNFNNSDERKWYPWFEKKISGWSVRGVGYYCGLAGMGSDFFFKSEELARYAATKFLEIYKEYLPE